MKKISLYILAAMSLIGLACNKVEPAGEPAPAQSLVHKTFTVTSPDTKTALGTDGLTINWSADDEINVIGVTADGTATSHTFTITDGAGSPNATFDGEVGENEVTFYAVYPNVAIRTAQLSASTPLIEFDASLGATQTAVKNGFDPHFAPMTAIADADGKLNFRHGAAFFKLTIGNENVTSVNLKTSKTRFQGRPQYHLDDGSYYNIQGAADNITLSGVLEKDATYYIPVLCKDSPLNTFTLTFSFSDGTPSKSISTAKLSSLKPALGTVYDLGKPVISILPEISAADVSLDANQTSGAIAYNLINPAADGVMTAALKEASDWLTVGTVSDGSVAFTCSANTGEARSAVVTLTYTYNGSETVTADVTVSQRASGVAESHEYIFYVNSSKSVVQTKDGEPTNYFTTAGGTADLGGDYSISSWTLGGYSSTKGWKMNSDGKISFTTAETLKTTVQFYFIRRKTGDTTAQIQITPSGGTAQVFDSPYDTIGDSGILNLEKNTVYTIERLNKEQALLLVVVNETE